MAERKIGRVVQRRSLSDILEIFRLAPAPGSPFPEYKAGQYIALSRDNCRLTKKIAGAGGETKYVYDLDEEGHPRWGSVTHSYSISSAPFETVEHGDLEFYVVLEMIETGTPGRLSESLFKIDPEADNKLSYVNKITGEFTLEKRAAGYQNVVMVGTGTGLAPFASMIKQLDFEARGGSPSPAKFTLLHANRTFSELGYHEELLAIEARRKFDFLYLPSVSRPTARDAGDPSLGKGRANNILRTILGMPLKEEQVLRDAAAAGGDVSPLQAMLDKTVRPVLPEHISRERLLERMDPERTVIITCGSPGVMEDIKTIADATRIRFEKEDW
jgi:ferredoxin-NADP reductase